MKLRRRTQAQDTGKREKKRDHDRDRESDAVSVLGESTIRVLSPAFTTASSEMGANLQKDTVHTVPITTAAVSTPVPVTTAAEVAAAPTTTTEAGSTTKGNTTVRELLTDDPATIMNSVSSAKRSRKSGATMSNSGNITTPGLRRPTRRSGIDVSAVNGTLDTKSNSGNDSGGSSSARRTLASGSSTLGRGRLRGLTLDVNSTIPPRDLSACHLTRRESPRAAGGFGTTLTSALSSTVPTPKSLPSASSRFDTATTTGTATATTTTTTTATTTPGPATGTLTFLSPVLKELLADDWVNITQNGQLLDLPATVTVRALLTQYLTANEPKRRSKHLSPSTLSPASDSAHTSPLSPVDNDVKTLLNGEFNSTCERNNPSTLPNANNPDNKQAAAVICDESDDRLCMDALSEFLRGLLSYFNAMVGRLLLYASERSQYVKLGCGNDETGMEMESNDGGDDGGGGRREDDEDTKSFLLSTRPGLMKSAADDYIVKGESNDEPADVYGAIHFLRLLVTLPAILSGIPVSVFPGVGAVNLSVQERAMFFAASLPDSPLALTSTISTNVTHSVSPAPPILHRIYNEITLLCEWLAKQAEGISFHDEQNRNWWGTYVQAAAWKYPRT